MKTKNGPTNAQWAEAFASACDAQSRWREIKAEEYPDDKRNQRSADAFSAAAAWARDDPEAAGRELDRRFGDLDDEADEAPMVMHDGMLLFGEEGSRVFQSYGFHNEPEIEDWLGWIREGIVREQYKSGQDRGVTPA